MQPLKLSMNTFRSDAGRNIPPAGLARYTHRRITFDVNLERFAASVLSKYWRPFQI
jgi:hypothetical protein